MDAEHPPTCSQAEPGNERYEKRLLPGCALVQDITIRN